MHSPPATDTPQLTTREALSTGEAFLVDQGAVGSFRSSANFERQSEPREFLLTGLGFDGARTAAQGDVPIAGWHLRWFRHGDVEEWSVRIAGNGQVTGFTHTIAEGASGGRLRAPEARVVVDSVLIANDWVPSAPTVVSANLDPRASRADHRT